MSSRPAEVRGGTKSTLIQVPLPVVSSANFSTVRKGLSRGVQMRAEDASLQG
jgi:hypothetical protein